MARHETHLTRLTAVQPIFSITALAIAVSLFQVGCFRDVLLAPNSLSNTEVDIVVSLKDGRKVSFASDNYRLTGTNGRQTLSGSGRIFVKGSSQFSDFNGSIPVDEIESIKTSEKTGMFYISLVVQD